MKEFNRNNRRPSSSTSYPPSPTKRLRPTENSNKSNLFISRSEDDQLDQLEVIESFDSISVDPEALAHIVTQTRELNEQNRRVTKKQDVFISFLEQKKTRNVVRMDWSGSKLYALDPDALEHSIQRLQEVRHSSFAIMIITILIITIMIITIMIITIMIITIVIITIRWSRGGSSCPTSRFCWQSPTGCTCQRWRLVLVHFSSRFISHTIAKSQKNIFLTFPALDRNILHVFLVHFPLPNNAKHISFLPISGTLKHLALR